MIIMEIESEPTFAVEKEKYFNMIDKLEYGLLCLSISPNLIFYVESTSTPNEV